MIMISKFLEVAFSQYGITEVAGNKDNPEVLKYFDEIGFNGSALKDETSWCSAFVNFCAKKAGLPFSGELTARSWLGVGQKVDIPTLGDIVVFWRENPGSWKGHVGIFIREEKGVIYTLGGNQRNQVNITAYSKDRILGFRRLQ